MATNPRAEAAALARVDLSRLEPAERATFLELAEKRMGGEGLFEFICRVAPHEIPPPHLVALIDAIERARRGPVRVCISMPPRHAKTITILRAIAWWLSRRPADTCAYLTYAQELANSKSRITRNIARRIGVQLADDANALHEWRTTRGGGLLAGGAGGGLTGQGVTGFAVVDDPFKNREQADSELYRETVWEWFNEVVMTRLERASVFVVHTRWHEDDLIGRLEKDGQWEIIRLPAIAEEGTVDTLNRRPGEALWPERFPAEELGTEPNQRGTLRGQIGEFSFAALYQQNPRPRGAKLFGPASYYDPATFSLHGWQIFIGGDPAASEKTSADWSVALALAVRGQGPDMEGRILDMYRGQVSIPEYARQLRAMQLRWHMAPVWVESVGGFKAVPQILREQDPHLIVNEAPAVGDKFQRAQLASAAWNSRPSRLLVPLGSPPWLAALLYELDRFTGVKSTRDDIVDGLSHAWNAAALAPKPPEFKPRGPLVPTRF